MGGMGSCLGGAHEAGASRAYGGGTVTDAVPQRVAEVHPSICVVQVVVHRYSDETSETWEGATSGFVLKDAPPNCIITPGHAVSHGRDELAHGRVNKIEMVWKGHLFTIKDPIEGVDFVVHVVPEWQYDPDGRCPRKFDIACLRFFQPSSFGRHLSDIMAGGLDLSRLSSDAGCGIIGYDNNVAPSFVPSLPWQPGTLSRCLNVLLPRYSWGRVSVAFAPLRRC